MSETRVVRRGAIVAFWWFMVVSQHPGGTLTATDVAVAAGLIDLGDRRRVADLPADLVKAALARMHATIEEGVDRMKTDAQEEPLIAVGGRPFVEDPELALRVGADLTAPDAAAAAERLKEWFEG